MPAPTNISALTAIDLGASRPVSVTQDVHFAGTTYTVWYSFTANTGEYEVGLWGYGDFSSSYIARTKIYVGPASAPVAYLGIDTTANHQNCPVQIPTTPGTTYYVRFQPNSVSVTPAMLNISMVEPPTTAIAVGSIAVNDDTEGFPLAIMSSTADDTVLQFIQPFPQGESGDVLNSGLVLVEDFVNATVVLYDTDYQTIIASVALDVTGLGGCIRTCQGTQRFWVAYKSGATRLVKYVTDAGVEGTAHTLTAITNVFCIAANNDETILYHTASGTNQAINRWDLVNDVALTTFLAGVVNYYTPDILILSDDTIILLQVKTSATIDVKARQYDAAGTLLNTYNLGSNHRFPLGTPPRLAYAIDDPNSFWVMSHPATPTGTTLWQEIDVATGTILTSRTGQEFSSGVGQADAADPPLARFGNAFSCPFWITREAVGGTGTIEVIKTTAGGSTAGFDFTASGGLTPDEFTLADGETQTYEDVPVGSGYGITEVPVTGWTVTYNVSNGTIDNLIVVAGETTTVAVTNSPVTFPNWLGSRVTRYPRRLIRSPIISANGNYVRVKRLQLDFQPGMAAPPVGVPRDVMLRVSNDGGNTWSSFRVSDPGDIGQYLARVQWWQVGFGRAIIIEEVDHLPNCLVTGWLDAEECSR